MTYQLRNKNMKTTFENEFCKVYLNSDKTFSGRDITDVWNEQSFFTRNIRSYKRGLAFLQEKFNESSTMFDVVRLLDSVGLNTHVYCACD